MSGEGIARTLSVEYGVGSSETSVYLDQSTWCHLTKYHNLDLQVNVKNKTNTIYAYNFSSYLPENTVLHYRDQLVQCRKIIRCVL